MATSRSSISSLSKQIANAIGEMAGEREVAPTDIRYNEFLAYLKDEQEVDKEDLQKIRLHLQHLGGFIKVRDAFFTGADTKTVIESVDLREMARVNRRTSSTLAVDQIFLSRFEDAMKRAMANVHLFPGKKVPTTKHKSVQPDERVVALTLSDTHFASCLDPRELPIKYDYEEEARALAVVMLKLCEFKKDYRSVTRLVVNLLGDIAAGKLHDPQQARARAEQTADCIWLLTQAFTMASHAFSSVDVYCATGNHERDKTRHLKRATNAKWDSQATAIYYGVKNAFQWQENSNVTIHIPRTPFVDWSALGHRFYGTHGDTHLNCGSPGSTLPVGQIQKQMQQINLEEVMQGRPMYDVFVAGHTHQALETPLPPGTLFLNPALTPIDGYAQSIGCVTSKLGQGMFEVTREHAIGDRRWFWVAPEDLKDKSLDKVIIPFKDF